MRLWEVSLLYLFAFLCGLGAAYAVLSLGAERMFAAPVGPVAPMVLLPMLAGVALFSLVYGLGSGRMLQWRFWLIWPVVLFALLRGGVELMFRGYVSVFQGVALALVLVFAAGLLACWQRDGVSAPAQGAAS